VNVRVPQPTSFHAVAQIHSHSLAKDYPVDRVRHENRSLPVVWQSYAPEPPATSGWQQEGFDWNRIPGVTSIHLPLDLLKANVLNVDTFSGMEEMLYSDEAFAGGLSQGKMNGNFGMKLHEHGSITDTSCAKILPFHRWNDRLSGLGYQEYKHGLSNGDDHLPTGGDR